MLPVERPRMEPMVIMTPKRTMEIITSTAIRSMVPAINGFAIMI